jgi:hypothetical protein
MACRGLNGLSVVLSGISCILFVVGTVAYAQDSISVANTAWITQENFFTDEHFGLRSFANINHFHNSRVVMEYVSNRCGQSYCSICAEAGNQAFSLTLVAVIFTTIAIVLSAASVVRNIKALQIANVAAAIVTAAVSLSAVVLFMSSCWEALNRAVPEDDFYQSSLHWGPGSVFTLMGMILMSIVAALQVAVIVVGDRGYSSPSSSSQVYYLLNSHSNAAPSAPAYHIPTAQIYEDPSDQSYSPTFVKHAGQL